jgi:hypothetical protein
MTLNPQPCMVREGMRGDDQASTGQRADQRRTLYCGWYAAGGLGEPEELSAEGRKAVASAERSWQFHAELSWRAVESNARILDRSRGPAGAQERGQGVQVELQLEPVGGKSQWTERGRGSISSQRDDGVRCSAGDAGAVSGNEGGNRERRQRIRHARFRDGVLTYGSRAARSAEPCAARRQRH